MKRRKREHKKSTKRRVGRAPLDTVLVRHPLRALRGRNILNSVDGSGKIIYRSKASLASEKSTFNCMARKKIKGPQVRTILMINHSHWIKSVTLAWFCLWLVQRIASTRSATSSTTLAFEKGYDSQGDQSRPHLWPNKLINSSSRGRSTASTHVGVRWPPISVKSNLIYLNGTYWEK